MNHVDGWADKHNLPFLHLFHDTQER